MDKRPRLGSDPLEWVKDTGEEAFVNQRKEVNP